MVNNRILFLFSGFLSFLFFFIILFFFITTILSSKNKNLFALKKDTYISISLDNSFKKEKKENNHLLKNKVIKSNKESKKSEEIEENLDVNELFNDVWAKKIKVKKIESKKINIKRIYEIQRKIKIKKKETLKTTNLIKESINKIDLKSQKVKSTANEVNEYRAKIQALVYKYFKPPTNSYGHKVVAVIELSAIGKVLDFRILKYSINDSLNRECDKIKSRLETVVFPINPDNKTKTFIINLIPEEQ